MSRDGHPGRLHGRVDGCMGLCRGLDMSISPSVTLSRARRWLVVWFGYCAGQAKVRIWRADRVGLACVQLEWGHMTGSVAGN